MVFFLLFYLIRSFLLFLLFKLFSILKISTIVSSFSSFFTLFNAVMPIIFESSLIGKYYILSKLSYVNFLYKIPGLVNIGSYFFLQHNKRIYSNKIIYILLFSSLFFIFTFLLKNTFIYTLPWLFCIVYIVIKIKNKFSPFDIIFISTWLAQGIGTILYGYLNGFLSYSSYLSLLPIAIGERSLFVLFSILLFYGLPIFDLLLKIIIKNSLALKKYL